MRIHVLLAAPVKSWSVALAAPVCLSPGFQGPVPSLRLNMTGARLVNTAYKAWPHGFAVDARPGLMGLL